jgi:DNA-binding response OmpR family regulator
LSACFEDAHRQTEGHAMTKASAGLSQPPFTFPPGSEEERPMRAVEKAVILCIEDDPECALLIQEELEERGWAVIAAHDGREGLSMLRSLRVDLVLCDVNMPQMSGFKILEELGKRSERPTAPFIFLTGLGDEENEIAGRKLGADDYLKKPVDFDALHALIRERLGASAPRRGKLDEPDVERPRTQPIEL